MLGEKTITAAESSTPPQRSESCPICDSASRALFDFLCEQPERLCENASAREQHALTGGFCPLHTWQYEGLASPRGIFVVYPDVLKSAAERLDQVANNASNLQPTDEALAKLVPDNAECSVCGAIADAEKREIEGILEYFTEDRIKAAEVIPALCLIHLRSVNKYKPEPLIIRRLIEATVAAIRRMALDMEGLASESGPSRRNFGTRAEREMYLRGISKLVGPRSLSALRRTSG